MHLSCIFKSSFVAVFTAAKAPFSSLLFIYLKNSYSLTSLFIDEFCDALRNIKLPLILFLLKGIYLSYESLEGPLLKKENIFYLVITRKLTRNNEITNSL